MGKHTQECVHLKNHLLWQYQDLHNKNAEEYETGTSHIILKCRQSSCSILEGKKKQQMLKTEFPKQIKHHPTEISA